MTMWISSPEGAKRTRAAAAVLRRRADFMDSLVDEWEGKAAASNEPIAFEVELCQGGRRDKFDVLRRCTLPAGHEPPAPHGCKYSEVKS